MGEESAPADPLRHLRTVKNREVLEEQYDRYFASRKIALPTRFDAAQRAQLRKFFQVMDADGGGTIDVTELEGPLLSTGMVTNHRELDALMDKIATGGGEITFWEFLEAFKPPKPGVKLKEGEPDMKRLRFLLATAEHETLPEAFHRDHLEDGLSDAEEPVISLYSARAEALVRARQRASGNRAQAEYWFERLHEGTSGVAKGSGAAAAAQLGAPKVMSETQVAQARAAAERAAAADAMKRESHLTLNTRIGLHRRRFLMSTIMQEKDRYLGKRADLLTALRAAETRHDGVEAGKLKEALKKVEVRHGRRTERLEATRIVVTNERSGYEGGGEEEEEEGEGEGGAEGGQGQEGVEASASGVQEEEGGGGEGGSGGSAEGGEGSEDEPMPWEDPVRLAIHTASLETRLPRFQSLLVNLKRCVCGGVARALWRARLLPSAVLLNPPLSLASFPNNLPCRSIEMNKGAAKARTGH